MLPPENFPYPILSMAGMPVAAHGMPGLQQGALPGWEGWAGMLHTYPTLTCLAPLCPLPLYMYMPTCHLMPYACIVCLCHASLPSLTPSSCLAEREDRDWGRMALHHGRGILQKALKHLAGRHSSLLGKRRENLFCYCETKEKTSLSLRGRKDRDMFGIPGGRHVLEQCFSSLTIQSPALPSSLL